MASRRVPARREAREAVLRHPPPGHESRAEEPHTRATYTPRPIRARRARAGKRSPDKACGRYGRYPKRAGAHTASAGSTSHGFPARLIRGRAPFRARQAAPRRSRRRRCRCPEDLRQGTGDRHFAGLPPPRCAPKALSARCGGRTPFPRRAIQRGNRDADRPHE